MRKSSRAKESMRPLRIRRRRWLWRCAWSLLASGLLVSKVRGQTVSYSPIVGFVKVTLQGNSGTSGENFVAPALVEAEQFRGDLMASAPSANQLQAAAAVWNTNEFDTHATANSHYVVIVASANAAAVGLYTDIVSHTADTLTTADNLADQLVGGETIVIRKHKTIGRLFGAANESGLMQGGVATADTISILTPGNAASFDSFYYRSGSGLGGDGWRSTTNPITDRQHQPVKLGTGLLVERNAPNALEITIDGYVHEGALRIPLQTGYNLVDPMAPLTNQVSATPPGPAFTLGGTASASIIPSGLETIFAQGTASTGDLLSIFDGANSYTTYYVRATGQLGGAGWRTTSNPFNNAAPTVLPALTSLLFEIRGAGGRWHRPQPFIITP
jgi:uncharacterized protein (TIGR02597 family)